MSSDPHHRLRRLVCAVAAIAILTSGPVHVRAGAGTLRGRVTCNTVRSCGGAVVYVPTIPGRQFSAASEATIDQKQLTFVPHVLVVVRGTTVVFPNSDDVRHNVFSVSSAKRFNLGTYPSGVVKRLMFDKPGLVELLCNVHAEMSAYVIVSETPYAALVEPDGSFVLENVPAGTYGVVAWSERLGENRQEVTVREGETLAVDFAFRR